MDLKKYFTDDEIAHFSGLTRALMDDFVAKEKLNDGLGVRNEQAENKWLPCDENFAFADRKTILILPGSGTTSAAKANGMCKVAESMLPTDQKSKWCICSMHYEDCGMGIIPTVIRAMNLMDKYLVPLVATKDKEGDLHKINADKAAANMRNLIVFTHCYGGEIEKTMEKKLAELMREIGYTDKELDHILKQMCVVQHNNIDKDLGKNKTYATHLLRLSAADMAAPVRRMLYGSFRHYALTHDLAENDVAYLKVSNNERVLWANRIAQDEDCEHDGGYWLNETQKTAAGLKEEALFKAIFHEITSSDYSIENMEQVLKQAAEHYPETKQILTAGLQTGTAFSADWSAYQEKFLGTFATLKSKYDHKFLTRADILTANTDACFVEDQNGKFLMDYLLDDKNYKLASVLMGKMAPAMPTRTERGNYCYCDLDSKNKEHAADNTAKWAQQALDADQIGLYQQFLKHSDKAYALDYTHAKPETLAATLPLVFNKETYETCDPDTFLTRIVAAYAAVEQVPQTKSTEQIKNHIETLLFKEGLNIRKGGIEYAAEKAGCLTLQRMAKKRQNPPHTGGLSPLAADVYRPR
jgi:hypothetical protein